MQPSEVRIHDTREWITRSREDLAELGPQCAWALGCGKLGWAED
jgi:hypothetical protein